MTDITAVETPTLGPALDLPKWMDEGATLAKEHARHQWLIADWLLAGIDSFPAAEVYAEALKRVVKRLILGNHLRFIREKFAQISDCFQFVRRYPAKYYEPQYQFHVVLLIDGPLRKSGASNKIFVYR